MIGAYCIARGIDLIAHGFINEYTLAIEIEEGRLADVSGITILYIVGVYVLTLIGVLV